MANIFVYTLSSYSRIGMRRMKCLRSIGCDAVCCIENAKPLGIKMQPEAEQPPIKSGKKISRDKRSVSEASPRVVAKKVKESLHSLILRTLAPGSRPCCFNGLMSRCCRKYFGLTHRSAVCSSPHHPRGLAGSIHPRRCALRCKYTNFFCKRECCRKKDSKPSHRHGAVAERQLQQEYPASKGRPERKLLMANRVLHNRLAARWPDTLRTHEDREQKTQPRVVARAAGGGGNHCPIPRSGTCPALRRGDSDVRHFQQTHPESPAGDSRRTRHRGADVLLGTLHLGDDGRQDRHSGKRDRQSLGTRGHLRGEKVLHILRLDKGRPGQSRSDRLHWRSIALNENTPTNRPGCRPARLGRGYQNDMKLRAL